MYEIKGKKIIMNEGDFGTIVIFKFSNEIKDNIKIEIYNCNKEIIISKSYENVGTAVYFILTPEETNKLKVGVYNYKLYQYGSNIKNTLLLDETFIVEEGA